MRMPAAAALMLALTQSLIAQPITATFIAVGNLHAKPAAQSLLLPAASPQPASIFAAARANSSESAVNDTQPSARTRTSAYAPPRIFLEGPADTIEDTRVGKLTRLFATLGDGMIRITTEEDRADYIVTLNHSSGPISLQQNRMRIVSKGGDLIAPSLDTLSLSGGVRKACSLILHDWQSQ